MEEKEKLFSIVKEMHPTWSSEKQWAYVSIVITAEKVKGQTFQSQYVRESNERDSHPSEKLVNARIS